MLALVLRRLSSSIPLLLVVSFTVFSLTYLVPGDAAVTLAGGENASPQAIERVRDQLGLDRPMFVQYWDWLTGVATLDLGTSLYDGRPLLPVIADRFPVTLGLTAAALAFALPVALLLGVAGGARPGPRSTVPPKP